MQTSANYKKRIWYKRETGRISSASWGEYESASWGCGVSRQHCRQAHYWMPNPHGWSGWTTPVSHPSPLSQPLPPQTSHILSMHTPVNVPRPMPHVRTKASKWSKLNLEQKRKRRKSGPWRILFDGLNWDASSSPARIPQKHYAGLPPVLLHGLRSPVQSIPRLLHPRFNITSVS